MEEIKILVVQDEVITAMDIQSRLQKLGYVVPAIADSGEEAIQLAKELQPNLILMDIVLKGKMDGTQAALEISKLYQIPIIFLTAYEDDETFNKAKLSIPYGYVTKPFETSGLRNAVELGLFKYQTELKIAAAGQRYRSIMENASCGIFIINESGIISDLNKQAALIFGRERSFLIGKDFKDFLSASEKQDVELKMQQLLIEKKVGPHEGRIQKPTGSVCDIEYSAVYVENEKEKFIFSIMNDITERKRLHAQKLLSDKLATVGTLAAGIIHEINNPITWILSNLRFIKKKIKLLQGTNLNEEKLFAELLEVIQESTQGVDKIRSIVRNLKGFVRLDKDEVSFVDVHEALRLAINIAHSHYKNRAKLITNFAVGIPLLLLNSNKLQQVFLNLIMNAAQAQEENNLQKNSIQITTSIADSKVRIDISDTGKGISPDELPKIFEPFFTTKKIGIGTGLGLSICSDIVTSMDGEIKVKSEIEKGTTFSIYLPIPRAEK